MAERREQITVTLDPDLRKETIKRAADAEHRTVANYIRQLIAAALERQQGRAA